MSSTEIETHSGLMLDFERPRADQISLGDIAHALANTCRFGGHIRRFYSVAQHAVLVRHLVIEAGHPELGMAALHHDSHEAYVGDLPTPLKRALDSSQYRDVTRALDDAIARHLGISARDFKHPVVKRADELAMRMEAAELKINKGRNFAAACGFESIEPTGVCEPLTPDAAKAIFLRTHHWERHI